MVFEKSQWIWNKSVGEHNTFADFKIEFNGLITKKYILHISSCVNHMITLNGEYVPSSQREGYECKPEYQIVNLTGLVKDGKNEIIITVYSQGIDSFIWRKRPAGLIFELLEDGEIICVSNSDTPSRVSSKYLSGEMEKISSMLGYTFKMDLKNEDFEFSSDSIVVDKCRAFEERDIKDMDVSDDIPAEIIAQGEFIDKSPSDTPLGTRAYNAFLSSRKMTEVAENTFIGLYNNCFWLNGQRSYSFNVSDNCDGIFLTVDLKQNTVGYPSFDINVDEDARMVVSYGEHVLDMRPRSNPATYQFAYEVTLKKGNNKIVFPFRRTACRYFMALIYTHSATVSYLGMKECLYPIESPAQFECSDSIHTKIFEVAQRTLRLCMHDHYEDCPSREQAMYIMDSQIQVLCGYYALGEYKFPKSCLEMLLNSFRDDDFFDMIAPGVSVHTIPCFSINYIPLVWEYYMFSGDKDILYKTAPYMKRIINERLSYMNKEIGLIPSPRGKKFWNFTEWQKGNDGVVGANDATCLEYELFNMSYNTFYSLVCSAYSKCCREIGLEDEARTFDSIRDNLNKSIHKVFWDEEKSAYKSVLSYERDLPVYYTELANALAVCAGVCPDECVSDALSKLASGELLKITTSHARYKYDALMKQPEKYALYVMKEIEDIWGGMIYKGATSFWETENGPLDFSLSGSMCHGWSTIPIYVYFRYCLGVYPEKPGFADYKVQPKISNGYTFKGKFATPQGTIEL
ncbi:MAG: hypothetical protein IJP16_09015 [Clostridia bacterium]|nr:hypothetical protein [Clostridia bacterium]